MSIQDLNTFVSFAALFFGAGLAVGRFIEKVMNYINTKNDRH